MRTRARTFGLLSPRTSKHTVSSTFRSRTGLSLPYRT